MATTTLLDGDILVLDYCCDAGPADTPFVEVHRRHSISYVRKGSFGCYTAAKHFELVAGSFLIGYPGDEFLCRHDHHDCGDECLSIQLSAAFLDTIGDGGERWRRGALPPVPELAVFAELAQLAASGRIDIGLDEASLVLAARFMRLGLDERDARRALPAHLRGRMVGVAEWIDARSGDAIDLPTAAALAGLTPYHFLRTFKRVVGITPHQHLVRCRVRKAAQRLLEDDAPITTIALDSGFGDVSNFVRTFHRVAGVSPRKFRGLGRESNFFQEFARRMRFS